MDITTLIPFFSGGVATVIATKIVTKKRSEAETEKIHAEASKVVSDTYHQLFIDIQGQITVLQREHATLLEREVVLKEQYNKIQLDLVQLREENMTLKNRINALEEENNSLKNSIKNEKILKGLLSDLEAEKKRLIKENEELTRQRNQLLK